MTKGRVLIVAGSDSGGGAGIQADIKTVTALGGFAMTAITALTAQNTLGVHGLLPIPPDFIRRQIEVVMDDLGADCIKIGMLGDVATIAAVADALRDLAPGVPVVLDPVMVAKGGHALLAESAVEALTQRLLPMASVVTPNLPEAAALTGLPMKSVEDMESAAAALRHLGAQAVLLKGGHLESDTVTDVLATATSVERFSADRIATRHTHGTGCTTASAIAAGLAQGQDLRRSVLRARAYVRAAIAAAPGFGAGHGPLGHGVTVDVDRADLGGFVS
ncbi:MAG TPA: bifunctional hydroxymethylpyrimidine kinase/phosphomethylpyrimidine kinase [Rhodopila sp.]|uniref:bifunctional hydroxymethylpyrimidine kinase/phosphomethylpyrimidine kinase n=1 Tax=Rhodopila sp. TaxID=2480087 RepID=UPI002CFD64B7|nr:bifunctional hydroxymethylpyrimidine kinase/phosphomethylpyrimidine kinase [Rhodopila sp.]HVY18197.1 bifunctional hydroxymethylpyrimidine kinase/phosphomethylpyrimidine kinase [Rhodopila sp.]